MEQLFHTHLLMDGGVTPLNPRLDLSNGQLAAIAGVQTFGDYLVFHPHLHVLAAAGLVDKEGRFDLMPVEKRRGAEAFWTEAEPEPAGRGGRIKASSR